MVSIYRDPHKFLSETSHTFHKLSVYYLIANIWDTNNKSNFLYKKDTAHIIYSQTEAQNFIFRTMHSSERAQRA